MKDMKNKKLENLKSENKTRWLVSNKNMFLKNIEAKAKVTCIVVLLIVVLLSGIFIMIPETIVKSTPVSAFANYKQITIDHTQVNTGLSNFPVLVHIVDDVDLFSNIQNDSGYDIAFYDLANTTQFNHEIDYWDWDVGNSDVSADIWVNITSVSSSSDTVLNMYYNSSIVGDQGNPTGVWDASYAAVYHMSDYTDSTGNGYTLVESGAGITQVSGHIGNALDFPGNRYLQHTGGISEIEDVTRATCSAWSEPDSTNVKMVPVVQVCEGEWGTSLMLKFGSNAKISVKYADYDAHVQAYVVDAADYTTSYIHTVWSYNGTDSLLYINGSFNDSATQSLTINSGDPNKYFMLGATREAGGSVSSWFNGELDEVRVSSIERNSSWINACYNTMNNLTGADAFCTIGAERTPSDAGLDLPNNLFTIQTKRGTSAYANNSATIHETGCFYLWGKYEMVRVNVSDIHANITADNINISFSSDNATWGNWHQCTNGGETINVSFDDWSSNNWMHGSNPFDNGDTDADGYNETVDQTSIYWRIRVYIPLGIGIETYTNSVMTWDAGEYV